MSQSWETLRKEARRLETEIDAKLVEYSKIVASLQTTSATTRTSFETVHASTEGKPRLVDPISVSIYCLLHAEHVTMISPLLTRCDIQLRLFITTDAKP